MSLDFLATGLLHGLILALVAYAIMIPFRLLHFPDLTAEGVYPLGGAVCASLLLHEVHPLVALSSAGLSAGLIAMCTGFIHLYLRVNTLLAGIILSTMLYSVNLRLLGKPNASLFHAASILSANSVVLNCMIVLVLLAAMIVPLALLLRTDLGLRLRAVGLNQAFARRQNISIARYTILALFMAGCCTGVAGGLMVQSQYYMDVGMGIGIVIHGLAALMIGEALVGTTTLNRQLLAPLLGALVYQHIQGMILSLGLAPSDLKLFTGSLVLLVIGMRHYAQGTTHATV